MRYNPYHPYAVPSRGTDPPDAPDFWTEEIPQYTAKISDADGTIFYETISYDSENEAEADAARWVAINHATLYYEEYLEVLTEQVADRIAIHGNDPYDVSVEY